MTSYTYEPVALAAAIIAYDPGEDLPEGVADKMLEAKVPSSPVDKLVIAFDALREHVEALEDVDALKILAGAATAIMLDNFHGRRDQALGVRDAARARLEALA